MKKAFTFLEVALVLAISIVIGATILPNLLPSLEKSRLRADVQTVMLMQNALDLYRLEVAPLSGDAEDVIETLKANGYLTEIDAIPNLKAAVWRMDTDDVLKLDISLCQAKIKALANELSERERDYIR